MKRREVLGRFAALCATLDEAVAEGSIRRWTRAWQPTRGSAPNEVVMQSLEGELPALANAAPALSALLLRSVGAADVGAAASRR
jgi:hypothetical protein